MCPEAAYPAGLSSLTCVWWKGKVELLGFHLLILASDINAKFMWNESLSPFEPNSEPLCSETSGWQGRILLGQGRKMGKKGGGLLCRFLLLSQFYFWHLCNLPVTFMWLFGQCHFLKLQTCLIYFLLALNSSLSSSHCIFKIKLSNTELVMTYLFLWMVLLYPWYYGVKRGEIVMRVKF